MAFQTDFSSKTIGVNPIRCLELRLLFKWLNVDNKCKTFSNFGVESRFPNEEVALNTNAWPHVSCTACHNAPADHPTTLPSLSLFDSQTARYVHMDSASQLCGQCHGTLHFANTDHRIYDSWAASKHADTQTSVATELSQSRVGETPDDLIHGSDAENCIACHSPTAVLAAGGMTEVQAMSHFFVTANGVFATNTLSTNMFEWQGIACTACHDPHDTANLSYFNS